MSSPSLSTIQSHADAVGAPLDPLMGAETPLQRLWALLRLHRRELLLILAYAVAAGVLGLAVPLAVQALVNSIAFTNLMQPVLVLSALLLAALGLLGVMLAGQALTVELLQRRLFIHSAADLALRLTRVRREAFDQAHGPELLNRFFAVFALQKAFSELLLDGLAVLLQTLIGLLLMAVYHPLLLQFGLFVVAGLAVLLRFTSHRATQTALKESKAKFDMAAWLEELAGHPDLFRSDGAVRLSIERANALAQDWLLSRQDHWRILFRQLTGLLAFQAVASALLLGVGGWLVVSRQITLGQLVASEFVLSAVVTGLVKLAKQLETYYDALANVDKLGTLLDLPLERTDGVPLPPSSAGLAIRLSALRLSRGDALVLQHADVGLVPGARMGITGATGAGLGVLGELLAGLREPAAGALEFDGHDMRDLDVRSVRGAVALVRPDGVFAGSVLENLRVGRQDIELSHLRTTLQAVGLWETIQELPDGLGTPLATSGAPLSAGEAARLLVARAIAGGPRLIVVEEVLDILDGEARQLALDALMEPRAPWTLVVLSRHEAVLARLPIVYRLDQGLLVRLGPGRHA
ncbi:MAG: ABC transporter ATP-binding protein [Candidatus Sericytochromatia bacterium]|nr:ABC transporter ATP-binding protein [Candidatus Sericytochromatia bacterium]